jgi:hypothetical protein
MMKIKAILFKRFSDLILSNLMFGYCINLTLLFLFLSVKSLTVVN